MSGPDFVPLSGSDHAVSIARSVNASSSHGPAGCTAPRPQRRPVWPPDRCSNGQAVHVSGTHRPLPHGGSCASWRDRDTSRTVTAQLPHHSTACRSDRPRSAVIVCSASPARLSVSRTARSRSPSGSPRRPEDLRAGVSGRHVPCAVPPGIQRRRPAPLASSTGEPDRSHRLGIERLCQTIWSCSTYPQSISRFRCLTHLVHRRKSPESA